MDHRKLGNSGLEVSVIGLGANNFGGRIDYPQSDSVISQAIDLGINFIDTSNSYGNSLSEEYIGRSLEGRRDSVVIATKVSSRMGVGPNQAGNSRKHIMDQVEKSLHRLRTDYIDLYQIHWWDPATPIDETLRALDDLTAQGKIRYFGCSNFNSWQVCESIWVSKDLSLRSFISVQPHYSLLERKIEEDLIPLCERYDMGILPYFPLANGFLTGKYKKGIASPEGARLQSDDRGLFSDRNFEILEQLTSFCQERDKKIIDLAFAWLLYRKNVSSVIAGATKPEQVVINSAAGEWHITDEEYQSVSSILE